MRYVLTFMMLLVVSFVEASPAPDWVFGKGHPSYDPSQYLMGVGYSKENTVSASESARAELIKSIRVTVNSTIKDYRSSDKSFSEASISSESDFLLEGSQVKDGWYDEDKEIFYSLVVIKRQFVLDTLSEMINNIISKNSLTLRQADTFYNNGKIIKALVYYYDGYVESSKLLPYIQTYKSVIMEPTNQVLEENYNLLFKEKIQNIVGHIQLEKIDGSIEDKNVLFSVRATYKGRGIDNFPVRFFSVYKHHVERVICESDGCEIKTPVEDILNKNNTIFIKAVPDFKTFEKYFTYNLTPRLFGSFDVLEVSYKELYNDVLQEQEDVARQERYESLEDNLNNRQKELDNKQKELERMARRHYIENRQQIESDAMAIRMEQEIQAMKRSGCNVGCRRKQIPLYGGRGSLNFNIGFGKGRNRGNINIGRGW